MMIPITRKEQYINEIVGKGKTAPGTPQAREEFFYAAILGEVVAPFPVTNIEKYLAKIAGKYNGELPEPITRIEFFIARAAGMNVSAPTPITREEMFWANYAAVAEYAMHGIPPLTFNAVAGTLKNYRIYGQTVDGESVGDRTGNLFDETIYDKNVANNTLIYIPIYVGNVNYVTCSTTCPITISGDYDPFNSRYIFILSGNVNTGAHNEINGVSNGAPRTIQPSDGYVTIAYRKIESYNVRPWEYQTMLNVGSTPLPYEPYGYRVPVKVEGINILPMSTTPISTDVDDFHCEYDGAGTITLTTDKGNAVLSSFSIPLSEDFIIPVSVGQGGDGCVQFNNSIASQYNAHDNHIAVNFVNGYTLVDTWGLSTVNRIDSSYAMMGGKTITRITIHVTGFGFGTNRKLVIKPAFVLNTTEQVPFEPYQAPVTTNLYIPEQIRKVGDEAEYIDYGEQKFHRISSADLDVTLPALPTLAGTNVLSVETEVQPSNVYIKYEGAR
jgi:hypothetical protein